MDNELREFITTALPSLVRMGGRLSFFGVDQATLDWAEHELGGRRSQIAVVAADGEVTLSESVSVDVGRVDLLAEPRVVAADELGSVRVAYAAGRCDPPIWTRDSGAPAPWAAA